MTLPQRLSESEIIKTWNDGVHALNYAPDHQPSELFIGIPNLKSILNAEEPHELVATIDRRQMYLALALDRGEDAIEILPHLTQEQFVAIIDYEGWSEGQLVLKNAISWLELYKHHGLDQMFKRFCELDEEYQVAFLGPYIDMVDEDQYESLGGNEQDLFKQLPCRNLWYRVKTSDEKIEDFVDSLIEGGLGENIPYTYSLLQHACYSPPNENEALIRQFRQSRIEEDGFVDEETADTLYNPMKDFDGLISKYTPNTGTQALNKTSADQSRVFLDDVLSYISSNPTVEVEVVNNLKLDLLRLANEASAACRLEASDIDSLSKLLRQVRGLVSVGLEMIANGNTQLAADILLTERPKAIFKIMLSKVNHLRVDILRRLKVLFPDVKVDFGTLLKQKKYGLLLWRMDTMLLGQIDFELLEILKGLFNRHPSVIIAAVTGQGSNQKFQFKPLEHIAEFDSFTKILETLDTNTLQAERTMQ
jgi:hypothetical protein